MKTVILAIESSCDDTAAAVSIDGRIVANVAAAQIDHNLYGGVVPELASRLHQANISRVAQTALDEAGINFADLSAVACTTGPGLVGSLLVGVGYAKGVALGRGIPFIAVNHLEGHTHSAKLARPDFEYPYLCLTASGGHTRIAIVSENDPDEIIGTTLDDAAGEAFDKVAKMVGLGYPGGPLVDKMARDGDPNKFSFPTPRLAGFDYSFSGLKTAVLYFIQKEQAKDPAFIEKNMPHICASAQKRIVEYLLDRLFAAAKARNYKRLAVVGGVSANSYLRARFDELCAQNGYEGVIPPIAYCTDNAAMIAFVAEGKFARGEFASLDTTPFAS